MAGGAGEAVGHAQAPTAVELSRVLGGPVSGQDGDRAIRTSFWRRAIVCGLLQGDLLQNSVVPHLGFSEQSPALERTKSGDLAAQGFHRAVVSEILHLCPPVALPAQHLIPILGQRHYDSHGC
jgi:hypothetical protein